MNMMPCMENTSLLNKEDEEEKKRKSIIKSKQPLKGEKAIWSMINVNKEMRRSLTAKRRA